MLSGVEELRFSLGMFNEQADDYWSYVFVWWVDRENRIPASDLARYLELYFSGLAREIADFKEANASGASFDITLETMSADKINGSSALIDRALTSEVPSLHFKVQQRVCQQQGRLAVIFELSPKTFEHSNWKTLSKLTEDFKCAK